MSACDWILRISTARGELRLDCDGSEHGISHHVWRNQRGGEVLRLEQEDAARYCLQGALIDIGVGAGLILDGRAKPRAVSVEAAATALLFTAIDSMNTIGSEMGDGRPAWLAQALASPAFARAVEDRVRQLTNDARKLAGGLVRGAERAAEGAAPSAGTPQLALEIGAPR